MECKNCLTLLSDKSDYCFSCGGKVIRNRLSMRNLFDHFTETFFNYDNQFFRTFINLLKKPWDVIDTYVVGTRKKYISPLSFFAISLTLSGVYVYVVKKFYMEHFDMSKYYGNGTPEKFGQDILNVSFEYYSLLYFLSIPPLALMSRIIFFNKRYNYTEHLVIFFYTMSMVSIISSIISLLILALHPESMMMIITVFYFLYFIYQTNLYRKLFLLTGKQLVLKVLFFVPVFFMAYLLVSIVVLILMFSFGMVNLQDFAPPS